ncbi:GIY-YIG nuclease family protein [Sphingomonas desiccabilis]|uniref:GIY-YIG nuclease family protein n=2 Tax=Sphingomonas desiccabilis TaxID=429134 RepID=A0A4Q2IVP6_9SPHN|nr:GIY-YIG nuclease family protein [Sphingomonas desiccabilis]
MLNLFQHPCLPTRGATLLAMSKQPCVYILASRPLGTLYIGVTSDLVRRLHEHRSGDHAGFTSVYAVHRLVRYELCEDMPSAIGREKQLKRWHRNWKINLIESENPDWHDLAPGIGLPPLAPRPRRGRP